MILPLGIFSQNMTRIAVINGDTNILITPNQLRWANKQIATVEYLEAKTVSLNRIIDAYSNNFRLSIKQSFEYQKQIKAYKKSQAAYKATIEKQKKQAKAAKKQARKKKTRAIFASFGVGVIAGLILSIFI